MDIRTCLLDVNNLRKIDGITIGERVARHGLHRLCGVRPTDRIDVVVLHHVSAVVVAPEEPFDEDRMLRIFCDLALSSHYLIDRSGRVLALAPEQGRAWHAGGSVMPPPDGRVNVNDFSIGIELVATPDSGFTDEQYRTAARLCRDIEGRYDRRFSYVGHDGIAGPEAVRRGLRPDVKTDPGPLFDWGIFDKLVTGG